MEWVSGLVRGAGGRLQLKVIEGTGESVVKDLTSLEAETSCHEGPRRKGFLTLPALVRRDAGEHLRGLGIDESGVPGQPVYRIEVQGSSWSVPSQLLVMMLFGTRRQFRERLLTPFPLHAAAAELAIAQTYNPALKARLHWMLESPTAARAWSSVYRHALEGRLEMTMPDATIEVAAQGNEVNGVFLVTHARLLSLKSHDLGYDGQPGRVSTSQPSAASAAGFRNTLPLPAEPRLHAWTPSSRLTDVQWEAMAEYVAPKKGSRQGTVRRHDPRLVIETLLTKMATPLIWADVPGDRRLVNAASNLFQQLRHRRTLEHVINAVAASGA